MPQQVMLDQDAIRQQVERFRSSAEGMKDIVLSTLAMIGEIPAPTGQERDRVEWFTRRLTEFGVLSCSMDELGNGYGLIPGTSGQQTILVVAHADTLVTDVRDQTVEIGSDRVIGPFVGDNSLGLAMVLSLPVLMERCSVALKSNVILMATTQALGRGDLKGLKHFFANGKQPVHIGICVEGVQLGRLNHTCLGMLRGEVVCSLPEDYNWARFGSAGAILPMTDAINLMNKISLPRRPFTTIVLGSIHGGISHQNIARQAVLGFEIRSESAETIDEMRQRMQDIVDTVSAHSGIPTKLDVIAQRKPGGIDISHPLVRAARAVIGALGIEPMLYPTTSALAALMEQRIPAVTIGFTKGERRSELDEIDESSEIAPMFLGLAQGVGLLLASDEGGVV